MVGTCKKFSLGFAAAALVACVGSAMADQGVVNRPASPASTSLFSHGTDPLGYEMTDNLPNTGFVNRDPAECASVAANCQDWTRTVGTAGRSSDLVGIAALAGDDFKVADNFTVTSAQTLSSLCFYGFYGSTAGPAAGAFPTVGAEAFRIRVYGNTGSPNSGIPNSANILREWTVGANAGYGLTVDPNTTLTRGAAQATRPGVFAWTVNFGASQLALPPGCYWLEIVGATNGIVEGNRLRWVVVNGTTASTSNDGVVYQATHTVDYDYNALIGGTTTATDAAFCLNFALPVNNCGIPPAPTNTSCATAQTITSGFTATNVSTLRSVTPTAPFCGNNPVNGNALWYKVTGNGDTFTASSCGANTNFDTVINVYCGTCAGLNCVANNDTAAGTCAGTATSDPSSVSFATMAGVDYYIVVFGFELDAGFLDFSVTSAAGTPATSCASDRCPVDLTGVVTEPDACGVSTNSGADCNGGTLVLMPALGTAFGGTSYNLGTNRDFDFWTLPAAQVPDQTGTGSAWFLVTYQVEFPGIFNFFTGACAANNGTFLGGAFANYLDGGPACPRAATSILVNAPAGQDFRLNLLPVDFGGVPCAAGNNNYKITVTLAAVGACCVPNTAGCFVTVQADCADQTGNYFGDNTSCSPEPCLGACCAGDGTCSLTAASGCTGQFQGGNTVCSTDPCGVLTYACCTGGTCSLTSATGCTGGTLSGFACSPDPCAPSTGACCCGSGCTITTSAACSGTNQRYAGNGTVCNAAGNFTTPCCKGDYNKSAPGNVVSVQDIFDFLAGYFSGSNCSDTNGSGAISVQDIFDFLSAYFGGC